MMKPLGERIVAKVLIGPPDYEKVDDKIMRPFHKCTVITENGEMWDIECAAFGVDKDGNRVGPPTKEHLVELWGAAPDNFTKRTITKM